MNLRHPLALLSLLLLAALPAAAQPSDGITGRIADADTKEAMENATLQLYSIKNNQKDTTYVGGTLSDVRGAFSFATVPAGQYLLKVSYIGYDVLQRPLTKRRGTPLALGTLSLKANSVQLGEAVITANAPKMIIKDDTVVYNADAFRVPEGSVIEALVEVLPGAKIDDDGKVSINGKNVKKFKLDGRDFMTGNNDAVMKNIPSYVIDQVKAYDEKSDLSRLTGVDDGNDDFVLEFVTKRSARRGLQANPDIGYGTDHRYGIRLTAMKPFGAMRYTFMGNANNVNGRGFSGRGGRGRGNGQGQRHTKTAALDISYENNRDLKVSGRVTWDHNNTNNWSRTGSENFVNTRGGAFSNSTSQNYSRSNGWTGNMNLEWKIDTVTTLNFRPNVNFSTNDSQGRSTSASFNANPFDYVDDPLSAASQQLMDDEGLIVNSRENKSLGYGDSKNLSSQLQLYRRLNRNGRNVAVSSNISYRDGKNRNANLSGVHLYQQQDRFGQDSTYQTNRYTLSPSDNFSFSIGATYTEPLFTFTPKPEPQDTVTGGLPAGAGRGPFGAGRGQRRSFGAQGLFLQLNYRYSYSHQKSDPSTYDFPDLSDDAFSQALEDYREWNRLFGFLDNPYEDYLSDRLSRYSERTEYGHNADVQLRFVREKYNMNVGVNIQPQKSHYVQQYLGRPVDTVRTVVNLSPTLNLRYRFDQQTNLQVQFRGQTQQPNITQLLDIYDDTNPLSISMGNPGLKPSFTTNLSTNFQMMRKPTYVTDSLGFQVPKAQRRWSFSANGSLQRTSNSIGNVVTYNETTGGRISRPENINGNWSTRFGASFNIGLDTLNSWDISGGVNGSYNHHIGYVNLNRTAVPDRNVTHTYNFSPDVSLSFRNKWLNFSLNGRLTYARTENRLQASRNLTTWNFQYGGNMGVKFSWGTNLSTDIHMYSKRGYSDQTLNTNELLWNAQLSHSFLRGKKLTVMLQWYDILHEQTNFTRTVNANGWRDQEVNAITSYAMLHVSYRLNLFGGRNSSGEGRGDFEDGGRERRGGRGEGFGGGRGGRGGGFGGGFGGGRR
ncbi:MAG: outer membrane beta-barrel protein [Prevotella sp.]|nr:outer membrane beta-barrel protein [Prevotella sp.]